MLKGKVARRERTRWQTAPQVVSKTKKNHQKQHMAISREEDSISDCFVKIAMTPEQLTAAKAAKKAERKANKKNVKEEKSEKRKNKIKKKDKKKAINKTKGNKKK